MLTDFARPLISLLALATVAALFYAAFTLRNRAGIISTLEPYTIEPDDQRAGARDVTLAETTVSRRGVELTARLLRPSRILRVVESSLAHADIPIRPAEAVFFYAAGTAAFTLVGAVLGRSPEAAVVALAASALTPVLALRVAVMRRRRAFESQLPEALQMLAGSLRSGRSLLQALQGLADEVAEPTASEISRLVAQVRLGRPVEEALEDVAGQMASSDLHFMASAVHLHRQLGGNLAELLTNVAETMVARERLRGEVKALTAEGRLSAIVLGVLPVAIAAVMYVLDPAYISLLFHNGLGRSLVAGAGVLAVAGFIWMKKTMEVGL